MAFIAKLSDEALLHRLEDLAQRTRESTAELIAHLAELAARKAHRGECEGSLFKHCTQVLRLSEAATFNRIAAAYAARKFPVILDLLAEGSINLTTIRVLAPHLTAGNHRDVLAEATGKAKAEVLEIKARLEPRPDVRSSIRKLPAPRTLVAASTVQPSVPPSSVPPPPLVPQPSRAVVEPLAPERYRMEFTVGTATRDKFRRAQDFLRRVFPDGDPGEIFDYGLDLIIAEAEKQMFAATTRPRPARPATPGSRTIHAHVRRAVWTRDGGRCAFVGRKGRCSERSFLEYHHILRTDSGRGDLSWNSSAAYGCGPRWPPPALVLQPLACGGPACNIPKTSVSSPPETSRRLRRALSMRSRAWRAQSVPRLTSRSGTSRTASPRP